MLRRASTSITTAILAALMTISATSSPALAASTPNCGDTVTTNVTLTADLHCSGDGLIIGAHGVTIDLNQHEISGTGTGNGVSAVEYNGLTIRDGTISGFETGIFLESVQDATVRNMSLLRNGDPTRYQTGGLYANIASNLTVSGGTIVAPPATRSLVVEASNGVTVSGVDVTGPVGLSMMTENSVLTRNVFRDGRVGLSETYTSTRIENNRFIRSGIGMSEANKVSITGNHFTGSPIRIVISDEIEIRGNTFRDGEFGVAIGTTAPDVNITGNVFANNRYGIHVKAYYFAENEGLTVTRNTFVDNANAGLFIEATGVSTGTRASVTDNFFMANGFASTDTDAAGRPINDGLHINIPTGSLPTIARNHTIANADFGIEALPPGSVQDGGGNTSTGNPNGCAGVVCR